MHSPVRLLAPLLIASAAACGSQAPSEDTVHLQFKAAVADQPFSCSQTYTGLGTTKTSWTPTDFRLYVHDVRLVGHDGSETAVRLTDDGLWQQGGVALLDFEDKTGGCSNGTTATNDVVLGTVASAHYVGVRFSVGVPFAQNHQDVTAAPAPMNISGMFWDWQSGYKFVKIEGKSSGMPMGYNIHLGSTGCDGDPKGNVTACANPNVAKVDLGGFDPATSTIVVDLAALTATSDLDHNTPMTPPGCMSFAMDPECGPLFAKLGLSYEGGSAGAQELFRVK